MPLTGWAFAGPGTLLVVGLSIFPAVWAFLISRTRWNGIAPPRDVGWSNYQRMAEDPDLWASVRHTFVLTALFVPSSILLGLVIAIALSQKIRLHHLLPHLHLRAVRRVRRRHRHPGQLRVQPAVRQRERAASPGRSAAAAVPGGPQAGPRGDLRDRAVGGDRLHRGDLPRGAAGHPAGPHRGGHRGRRQPAGRYSGTLPCRSCDRSRSSPRVWQTITALQLFDLVFTTTRGGPLNASQTIVYYVYELAFQTQRYGYGSAVAYGLFALTMVLTIAMILYSRRAKVEAF